LFEKNRFPGDPQKHFRNSGRFGPLDDLNDNKELTFTLIQEACARQFRHHPDELHPAGWTRDHPGTPRRHLGPSGDTRKTRPQTCDPVSVSAYLCNFLDDHGVKPAKVLKKAGLLNEAPADWHSGDAVRALYTVSLPFMPQSLYSDSEAASDYDASVDIVDSDSDAKWLAFCLLFYFLWKGTGTVFMFFSPFAFSFCLRLRTWRARHSQPLFATRTCVFCNQLAYGRLVIRRAAEMATLGS
jgi:hypothetical protein